MLQTKSQIIEAIKIVAHALGDLNDQVVYVGGAVVGLYADDPGALAVRPTRDVDVVFKIASAMDLEGLREKLANRGIHVAQNEGVICRFTVEHVLLDVMATEHVGWAPANPWFKSGFEHAELYDLEGTRIKVMPIAYFLASKFIAFKDRGDDPRTSHDFEDIVYLLDNSTTVTENILSAEPKVRDFLRDEIQSIIHDETKQEAVLGHIEPAIQTERYKRILEKLKIIISD